MKTVKMKPTIFKLAIIAAQLKMDTGESRDASRLAIKQAMQLWGDAERELEQVELRAEYLREIASSVFKDSIEEWGERLKGYPGEQSDIDSELLRRIDADEARKHLFKDKRLTKQQRRLLFGTLVTYANKHSLIPPPTVIKMARELKPDTALPYYDAFQTRFEAYDVVAKNKCWSKDPKELDRAKKIFEECSDMSLHTARWAWEVRQRQISESKTRTVPNSLKGKRVQDRDSIQLKRKFTA